MSKKTKNKKKVYYYQGEPTEEVMKWLCKMADEGIVVYHQYGQGEIPPGSDGEVDPPS